MILFTHASSFFHKSSNGSRRSFWIIVVLVFLLASTTNLRGAYARLSQGILDKRIDIQLKKVNLRQALAQIERAADVKFVYQSRLVSSGERITFRADQMRLEDVLDGLFFSRKIGYEVDGDHIILTRSDLTLIQDTKGIDKFNRTLLSVSGMVIDDESNLPLPGVSILIKGTSIGTTTSVDGRFSLSVPGQNDILVFSFIGYATEEVAVGNLTEINVSLAPDVSTLSEVVVVGYGSQKKEDVISSISSVKGEDLVLRAMPNFEAGLQGQVAGAPRRRRRAPHRAPLIRLSVGSNSPPPTLDEEGKAEFVIPAEAGIQSNKRCARRFWILAFAGMTWLPLEALTPPPRGV